MDNSAVLDHLYKIESEAALLVSEAQAEADRRVAEAGKLHRAAYEDRCRIESKKLETELSELNEQAQRHFREEMEAYREAISSVAVDTGSFSVLLDRLIAGET